MRDEFIIIHANRVTVSGYWPAECNAFADRDRWSGINGF
jgi:hypothetical protein